MALQVSVGSPDTGPNAQESTLDGCKIPVKSQQSVGSQLKEEEFSQSIGTKTTTASNVLCHTLGIEHDETEPVLMEAEIGDIPMDVLPGPLAPPRGPLDTPCGPQDDSYLGPQGQYQPPANRRANEMSVSDLLIPSDVEASQDKQVCKIPVRSQQSDGKVYSQSIGKKAPIAYCSADPRDQDNSDYRKPYGEWTEKIDVTHQKVKEATIGQQTNKKEAVLKKVLIGANAAADQENVNEEEKSGQAKQNDSGKSQTSTVVNRSSDGRARGRPFSTREGRLGGGPSGSPRGLVLAVPPTLQNGQAVRRTLEDHSMQEHHNVNVSMPGRGALNTQGIRHGKACDVIIFANRIERLKTRNPAELRGYHQGVLLPKYLTPSHSTPSQYREGKQYIVIKRLGKGGSGVAFLLKDKYSGIQFVGKRVSVKDFAASEAVLWCTLIHRGIVRFLGLLLTDDGVMFLSSYQTDSETLQELIDRHVLDLGLALEIIEQLLVVVNWLHSDHHIVHFDIKPDNILVLPGVWVPKLIDFGLSREQIAESQHYSMDISDLGCTLECMIKSIRKFDNGPSSRNMHSRVLHLSDQMVSGKLTAAQALKTAVDKLMTLGLQKSVNLIEKERYGTTFPGRSADGASIEAGEQDCMFTKIIDLVTSRWRHTDRHPTNCLRRVLLQQCNICSKAHGPCSADDDIQGSLVRPCDVSLSD